MTSHPVGPAWLTALLIMSPSLTPPLSSLSHVATADNIASTEPPAGEISRYSTTTDFANKRSNDDIVTPYDFTNHITNTSLSSIRSGSTSIAAYRSDIARRSASSSPPVTPAALAGSELVEQLRRRRLVKHVAKLSGDVVLGGLMMVHERGEVSTCGAIMPQGGVQALETMIYTIEYVNNRTGEEHGEQILPPGVTLGALVLDDCDTDTYGLEQAVDFIKGSISNIHDNEYKCSDGSQPEVDNQVITGVVGAASSVTSIQVANLLRLFQIPQISYFSTSPELSSKQRFEYFSRTIPSDAHQVRAMVLLVQRFGWNYVSIVYEESNYGIKAFERLEDLLKENSICIAAKEKLKKDSGVAKETAYDHIVKQLMRNDRAKGVIVYGSDQEVAGVMRAVRRQNATGMFYWIGSDGWSERALVSDGAEPEMEGTISVQPLANPLYGFEQYFLSLSVQNNKRNPWFLEYWEHKFDCRFPESLLGWAVGDRPRGHTATVAGRKKTCTGRERSTVENTKFEAQLQFVSDAVMAFAYAIRDMHRDICGRDYHGLCSSILPVDGATLLQYLRRVKFTGLSGDDFEFDVNGDGPARYRIIHFKQERPGVYNWVQVGTYTDGHLKLYKSAIRFRLHSPEAVTSICSLPCKLGQARKYVKKEAQARCCWHCFNCSTYQIVDPDDDSRCVTCRLGTLPDTNHTRCVPLDEIYLRADSGWAIGAMCFSTAGILVTLFVIGNFIRHLNTPVVRASGRELCFVLLAGIVLCYTMTFVLVLRPSNVVCGVQQFGIGFSFTVVYSALLTKTNRISRIFNASKKTAMRPSLISPLSQLAICSLLVSVQVFITFMWMWTSPPAAIHHHPTPEDNLLVCRASIRTDYMLAFAYPILLILVCTVYAVLTRKIPEAFNESKHIGFTMYTTCVIWLAFVPIYFSTNNHMQLRLATMCVSISLSATITIVCLFSPKLYILLLRPERNVRQSMMTQKYGQFRSGTVSMAVSTQPRVDSGTQMEDVELSRLMTAQCPTCHRRRTRQAHLVVTSTESSDHAQTTWPNDMCVDWPGGSPPHALSSQALPKQSNDSSAEIQQAQEETSPS